MAQSKHDFVPFHGPATSEKIEEIARKELGETEELKAECLEQLRILIKESNLTCVSTDDFLLRFLRTYKFNIKKSFEALRNFVSHREDLAKSLQNLRPEVIKECFRLNILGILPYRDAQERLVGFVRAGLWNPDICSVEDLLTVCYLLSNYASEEETTQTAGVVTITDLTSAQLRDAVRFLPYQNVLRTFVLNCCPARYATIHLIRYSPAAKLLFSTVSHIIPKKIAKRIMFHQEPGEELFEHLPRSILPDELGGTLGPLNLDQLTEIMVDYLHKLKDEYHRSQQGN